jgi:hypothetical protein
MRIIALMFWIFQTQDSTCSANELNYKVEKYDHSPGIYFESKGHAKLYNTEWKTVVYINLKETTNQSVLVGQYIKHIKQLCQETEIRNWTGCNHFADSARDKFRQVQKAEDLLVDITDNRYSNKRSKRGVFNFIGEVSKILFGTLDDDDAKFYNEQIRHFEENSDSLTNLLKQQLIVVKSTLGTVN